jgi:flagellar hook-associated protein 1 FlgK
MGLGVTLSNALSGMRTSQSGLEVLSRNVSNAGTPGYHRQSLNIVDQVSGSARATGVERAFSQSLQVHYTDALSAAGQSGALATTLDRLQAAFGKPGDAGALSTMFSSFYNAMQALETSPDSYAARANVMAQAEAMASRLNTLTRDVQTLRQDTEAQMASSVETLNRALTGLQQINQRLGDLSQDDATRASLLDQRDRLVSQVAEQLDVQVDYRSDGSVALMTRTGVGLLDVKAASFSFEPAGTLSAEKQFSYDSGQSNVGRLILTTSSGTKIDLVQQNVLQSGKLAGLVELRDTLLVNAQDQLDEIAAALAQAFSTVTTQGAPESSGGRNGYSIDLAPLRAGNDFTLSYTQGGVAKSLKVVNVADPGKLPLDYVDANGTRVVGADFSAGGAAVALAVQGALGSGFAVSAAGSTLTVLDDGAANTTDVGGLVSHATATATQGELGLSLFVDGGADFTNSLDGRGQKLGFAGRIAVNPALVTDNTLLVKSSGTTSLADATRPTYLLEQLDGMRFASGQSGPAQAGSFRLGGTLADLIAQSMDYVGGMSAAATSENDTQQLTMETLQQRLDSEYGVNVDEEMARLMELQNAYAANSRVIAVVQELMNRLMEL